MKISQLLRNTMFALACCGICLPQPVIGATPVVVDGIPVSQVTKDLALQDGQLIGALVDAQGRGVGDAPVVVARQGRVIAEIRTNEDGRYALADLQPGVYQVASHGGVITYRVWSEQAAPSTAQRGAIQQVDPQVSRGASNGRLLSLIANPLVIAAAVATAIAVPMALDDDDDAS